MSAAFALSPSGPPAPCGYPKCTLEAFHEGEHILRADKRIAFEFGEKAPRRGHCVVCGTQFVVYGDHTHPMPSLCDSPYCAAHYRVRMCGGEATLLCPCSQRPYPHELSVHALIRRESYNPKLTFRYPWSLCLSQRREMSTEDC